MQSYVHSEYLPLLNKHAHSNAECQQRYPTMTESEKVELSYHKVLSQESDDASDSDNVQSLEPTNRTTNHIDGGQIKETNNDQSDASLLQTGTNDISNAMVTENESEESEVAGGMAPDSARQSQPDINEEKKIEVDLKQQGMTIQCMVLLTYNNCFKCL